LSTLAELQNQLFDCAFCGNRPQLHGIAHYFQACCDSFDLCPEVPCAPPAFTAPDAVAEWNKRMTFILSLIQFDETLEKISDELMAGLHGDEQNGTTIL